MDYQTGHVMTLANSIIGVGVLAMPYCFKQCGIILSIIMLFVSSIISRLACHFLLKSAIMARRKTFEFLAFHAFGALGKFIIEVGLIGFLVGTCIAFFVVMGDLGPEIIAEITGTKTTSTLRTSILMALALFCVLPLGLLRNIDSLNGVSKATIGFYCCLVLKIIVESLPRFVSENWFEKVELWRPAGILQCLPIFSMALFCQTQLFEIYQAMPNASLEKMNNTIRVAVNICTSVYIFVGMFGYIAFFQQPFSGNILLSFKPSIVTDVMKIGFILSVAFSFPLVIFPCRASLYSLLYKNTYPVHEGSSNNYIPEGKFKGLTFLIVLISLIIGVLIPNIELVLGLVGSTIGVMICVLFPVACFICMSPKNTNERILAQIMLFVGVLVMVLGTYANLYAIEEIRYTTEKIAITKSINFNMENNLAKNVVIDIPTTIKNLVKEEKIVENIKLPPPQEQKQIKEIRHEPPQPEEPPDNPVIISKKPVQKKHKANEIKDELQLPKEVNEIKQDAIKEKREPVVEPLLPEIKQEKIDEDKINLEELLPNLNDKKEIVAKLPEVVPQIPIVTAAPKLLPPQNIKRDESKKGDEVDIEAIKKEEKELKEQEKEKANDVVQNQELIDTLQKQNEVQQELVKQQKELIEVIKQQQQALENEKQQKEIEKLKAVKQIEKIAKKAIESLSVQDTVNKQENTNKEKRPSPAPILYQLSLNVNNTKNNIKALSSQDIKNLVPIPIALSDNVSAIYKKAAVQMVPTKINVINKAVENGDNKNSSKQIVMEPNIIPMLTEQRNLENEAKQASNKVVKMQSDIKLQQNEIGRPKEVEANIVKPKEMEVGIVEQKVEAEIAKQKVEAEIAKQKVEAEIAKQNEVETFKRDILSENDNLIRQKRESNTEKPKTETCDKTKENISKIPTNSELIKKIVKLSDPELVTVNLNVIRISGINVPVSRDLKSFEDIKRK